LNNAIKTVVRQHHWTPEQIKGQYLDDIDLCGLMYWYNDTIEMIKEMETKK